jgi:nucleotide-binding universal stress UspA family protein
MFDTIVWASDGSARDEQSLPVVREICARYARSLRIVHVVERLPGPPLPGLDVHGCEDRLVARLKARTLALRRRGINASLHVIRGAVGQIADHVAAVAVAGDAQLIIAGGRGRSAWEGAVLGSVTQRLLAVAPCPVLVLPTPQPDRAAAASERPHITV